MTPAAVIPDTTVTTIDAQPAQGAPLDSTRLFIAAESFRGFTAPTRFRSGLDLTRNLERTGAGIPVFDAIDVALREGVPEVYLVRMVGAAAAKASISLNGPGGQPAIVITANEPGEWANGATGGLTAEVIGGPLGGTTRQVILRRALTGAEVGRSPVTTVRADFLGWNALQVDANGAQKPSSITVSLGSENAQPSIAAPGNLTGGNSDSGGITSGAVGTALARIDKDIGPGQVIAPGRSTLQSSTELLTHARDFNRTALLEGADGLAVGDLLTLASQLRALGNGATGLPRLGGLWAQNAVGPSVVPGQTRSVPWTVVEAGLIASLERQEGHPNVAPFADEGVPTWATSVTRYFSEADAASLYAGGVNVVGKYLGVPRAATFHSVDDPTLSEWSDLAHTRLDRAIRADAFDVGRNMGARVINRKTVSDFGGRLRLRLEARWKAGATFGDTAEEASRVEVDSVNDKITMAAREVNASIGVRMSEHTEHTNITIAKVPIGQEV